jgi:uncharacterized protein (DUF1697 family)
MADEVTPTHAAFLRGVNVGGKRKTASADLCTCFEGIGLEAVQTFRTSGNVVVGAGREPAAKLRARMEAALKDAFGFEVVVFLRTAKELRAIVDNRPFPAKAVEASDGKLQVALLADKPSAAVRKQVLEHATDEDRLDFGPRELYWLPSGRMSDSALALRTIEKLTDPWTMRTQATLELVAARFFRA